jgi:hypothetical protein
MLRIHQALVAFFVIILLAACGQTPATVTAVTLPEGWQTVRSAELVFALPPTWEVVNAEDGNFEGALDDLVSANPHLEAVASQGKQALASGNIAVMAFDLDPDHVLPNFTTNVSAGRVPLERLASLDEVGTVNQQQLVASGFQNVQRDTIRIGARDAVRLRSVLNMQAASETTVDLAVEQVILVEGQHQYVLTLTTTTEEQERLRPTFDQIVGTLQIE